MNYKSFEEFSLDKALDRVVLFKDNVISFVNKSFEEWVRLTRKDLCGKSSNWGFLSTTEEDLFKSTLQECIDQSQGYLVKEFCVVGSFFVCNSKVVFCHYKDDQVVCYFRSDFDLSDTNSHRLKWFERFNESITQIWVALEYYKEDSDFRVLYTNRRTYDVGNERISINSMNLIDHFLGKEIGVSREKLAQWAKTYIKLDETNSSTKFETDFDWNGRKIYLSVSVNFAGYSERNNPMFIEIIEDITESKLQLIEIEKQKKAIEHMTEVICLLQEFFDRSTMRMGILEMNSNNYNEGIHLLVNPAHAYYLGFDTTDEAKGKSLNTNGNFEGQTAKQWSNNLQQAKKSNQPVIFEYKAKNGEYCSCCAIHKGGDRFAYLTQDITHLKAYEKELTKNKIALEKIVSDRTKELQKAVEVKSRFLATMSHEIRTPLSGIMSILTLLSTGELSEEQHTLLRMAKVCGEQLLVVINDILDITRIEDNRVTLEIQPFSLRDTLEDSLEVVAIEAERKNIELISDVDPSLQETVYGDQCRLRQIVINLLSNAVKFSEKGEIILRASIRSELSYGQREIVVSVQDQGIGIPDVVKNKLFEPFSQADCSSTRRYGGSGLGLTISKRLAVMMGGDMWFESNEGKGSTFYFSFTTESHETPPRSLISDVAANKMVLLVDSVQTRLQVLSKRLTFHGLRTMTLPSGTEARAFFQSANFKLGQIDLVITDLYEAQYFIYDLDPNIPIVLMGYHQMVQMSKPFVKKPVREKALQLVIYQAFTKEPEIAEYKFKRNLERNDLLSSPLLAQSQRLLLAEDNLMNQKIIASLLKKIGYTNLEIVDNGKEALEAVQKKKYDIILMDCMMPEMNGITATELIRKLPTGQQPVAIIALTADVFSETRDRCFKAGMQDFITKPIQINKLKSILRKYSRLTVST